MNTGQIQIRISLTDQLYDFLLGKSSRLGVPVTQVVKHMIVKEAEQDEYPTFRASPRVEKAYKEAMANRDKAVKINDIDTYFNNLIKSK